MKLFLIQFFIINTFFILNIQAQEKNDSINIPFNCSCKVETFKKIYTDLKKMPVYIEGNDAYFNIFQFNIDLLSGQDKCHTKSYLSFVIDTLGKVTNKCFINTCYSDRLMESEKKALSILDKIGNWIPGEINGEKVPFEIKIPITVYEGE